MDNDIPKNKSSEESDDVLERILLPADVKPAEKHEAERYYGRPDPTPHWKIALEVGAIALGCVLAWIYWGQLNAMQGQLSEMKKASRQARRDNVATINAQKEIAQTTLATSQENFVKSQNFATEQLRLDQRAWVGVDTWLLRGNKFEIGQPVDLDVMLMNRGKTPAVEARAGARYSLVLRPETSAEDTRTAIERDLQTIDEELKPLAPISPNNGQRISPHGLNNPPLDAGRFKTVSLGGTWYGVGKLTYKDVFGRPQWVTYCIEILLAKGEPIIGYCPFGNDMSH